MSDSSMKKNTSPEMALLQHLVQAIKRAGVYNRSVLGRPKVILWTDKDSQWLGLMPALSQQMPELWVALALGQSLPNQCRGGTATYLRYALERETRSEVTGTVPVLYLSGIERADFRSPETFSKEHRHLYPLCHQGSFFSTMGGRDWTPVGFLSSKESAIGLEVPGDHKTKESIQLHLAELFRHSPAELKGKLLNAQTLATLFAPDPIKGMLEWIGKGNLLVKEWGDTRWKAFVSVAQNQFKIHPEKDGQLSAAEKLVEGGGPWEDVWARFCESPKLYPGILQVLDQVTPKSLFGQGDNRIPLRNLAKEKELAEGLEALVQLSAHEGQNQLARLVENHRSRAQSPWAELGKAPLARAVVKLGDMLHAMQETINASNWQTAAQGYLEKGWQVDLSARHAMALAKEPASHKVVAHALQGVYRPWLTDLANRVQNLLANYPCERSSKAAKILPEPGTLTLFVDGLRADVALELCRKLEEIGVEPEKQIVWAALPTVTATAKPAFDPVVAKLSGELLSDAFEPQVDGKDKPCRTEEFRTLLRETGFAVLGKEDWGDPNQAAWQEVGSLDSKGHSEGGKLARFIEEEITNLVEKIHSMLGYGWQKIRVVTDHGWLWLPDGLPHVELPGHLTASKWGRCALAKSGAQHGLPEVCWFWGNEHSVVVPPGIGVFLKKTEYSHGGVSLQECLKVHLTIYNQGKPVGQIKIIEAKWTRLRLKVQLEGMKPGLMVDVRSKAADSTSSLLVDKQPVAPDGAGHATLFADDDMNGYQGALVVLDNEQVVAKHLVTVGENN